ncbi:type VII secretion protein EccC [Streptomyces spiroverticillatus]
MTTRLIHRPARTTRPPVAAPSRSIEAPPNLPEGKMGNIATSLLPVAGVMSSVVMMTVLRNSQFAAIGALILVVTVIGSVALVFSQKGKAQRTRRTQREAYLEYLEDLREELAGEERERRERARVLNPPPDALYDLLRDPARLWERRRVDSDFLQVRLGTGEMPVRDLTLTEQGSSVLTPPDRFMLNEASALMARFSSGTELPLTAPLDRAGNISVIGPREDCLRVVRTLLVQTAVTHAPDDVALALSVPDERVADWEWVKWLPHVLDAESWDGPVAARRIASSPQRLARLTAHWLRRRASYAAEVRRGLSGKDALAMSPRMLVVCDGYGEDAVELPRPDEAVGLREMGVSVLHLLAERVQEPGQVSVRITVDGDRVSIEDLRGPEPVLAHGTADEMPLPAAEGLPRADAVADAAGLGAVLERTAHTLRATWPGEVARPVRVLPHLLEPHLLPGPAAEPRRVPFALDQSALSPVHLDLFGRDQHLLVMGDSECGKTNLLRAVAQGLIERHGEDDLVFAVMDPRRSLRGAIPEEYRGGYAYNTKLCTALSAGIATELAKRMPDDAAGDEETEPGSWGSGPRIVVLVDDYDILTTAGQQPLAPFLPYLPSAADIGLHFVLTRRVAGASRGLYEPVVQSLRESGAAALVMSGDRGEGQLFSGVYASQQPAGRGVLVRRGEPQRLIQTVWTGG